MCQMVYTSNPAGCDPPLRVASPPPCSPPPARLRPPPKVRPRSVGLTLQRRLHCRPPGHRPCPCCHNHDPGKAHAPARTYTQTLCAAAPAGHHPGPSPLRQPARRRRQDPRQEGRPPAPQGHRAQAVALPSLAPPALAVALAAPPPAAQDHPHRPQDRHRLHQPRHPPRGGRPRWRQCCLHPSRLPAPQAAAPGRLHRARSPPRSPPTRTRARTPAGRHPEHHLPRRQQVAGEVRAVRRQAVQRLRLLHSQDEVQRRRVCRWVARSAGGWCTAAGGAAGGGGPAAASAVQRRRLRLPGARVLCAAAPPAAGRYTAPRAPLSRRPPAPQATAAPPASPATAATSSSGSASPRPPLTPARPAPRRTWRSAPSAAASTCAALMAPAPRPAAPAATTAAASARTTGGAHPCRPSSPRLPRPRPPPRAAKRPAAGPPGRPLGPRGQELAAFAGLGCARRAGRLEFQAPDVAARPSDRRCLWRRTALHAGRRAAAPAAGSVGPAGAAAWRQGAGLASLPLMRSWLRLKALRPLHMLRLLSLCGTPVHR
jgi:hypothetical protein